MSGFEAAGSASAILPLIVSAIEHCISVPSCDTKSFKRGIFRNQCGILMQELADHDAALVRRGYAQWGKPPPTIQ